MKTFVRDARTKQYFTEPPWDELNAGRGAGRTYKMLQRALAAALEGRTVYVLAYNPAHRLILMGELQSYEGFKKLFNVHVSYQSGDMQLPSGQIRFRTPDDGWDWRTGQFRGMPPGVPVFIDHCTWERELTKKEAKK